MKIIVLLSLLLLGSSCLSNPLRSLERSLGVSDLKSLKRKPNQERWELSDKPNWDRISILKDLRDLGFVDAIKPRKQHYKSAVILGGTGPRMKSRINYLTEVWNQGTRFDRIVFLTGDRDLGEPDKPSNPGLAKNETELLRQLWTQAHLPEGIQKLPLLWIDAPKIKNPDGSLKRPTTVSTLNAWRAREDIQTEDLLAFSNQPLVYYQQCALKIETVGAAAESETPLAVYLDALASCLEYCPVGFL